MEESAMGPWAKKFRALTLALIFSGALNIGLVATLVFSAFQEKEASLIVSHPATKVDQERAGATLNQLLSGLSKLSFRELVTYLTNRNLVEDGLTKRDLALSALVSFHHFHLEKALGTAPVQRRPLALSPEVQLEVFPGLSEDQFEAIVRFAYEEIWPLTTEGLFPYLKHSPREESLEQAFAVTPEFHALQVLFQKTDAPQEIPLLLNLISEGNWDLLNRFAREQAQMLDHSVDKRRRLLLSYLALHSSTAANLLLRTDYAFALKKLDDRGILDLLLLLKDKTAEAQKFCTDLLRSPRTDAIWHAAAERLYGFAGETPPASFDLKVALSRFAPAAIPVPTAPPARTTPAVDRYHVVTEGESLWKIARLYNVKVDDLIKLNGLEKDRLVPGMTLKLPQGTGSEPPR